MTAETDIRAAEADLAALAAERDRLLTLINAPELDNFLRAVHIEAVHQVERWGTAHDRAKRPADWFWLVGYLGGKALHAAIAGDRDKARHHCISTAAALYNWHCAIQGVDVRMCPGRSDLAAIVDAAFPGEAPDPGQADRDQAVREAYEALAGRAARRVDGGLSRPVEDAGVSPRTVAIEGCLLWSHGGTECPGSRPGNPPGACRAIGSTAHDQCPRSGSYTGPMAITTTMPADPEVEMGEAG